MPTLTRFSAKGRPFTTASCARRTLAAATSFMASVIFCVLFTDAIRSRVSFRPAMTCHQNEPFTHLCAHRGFAASLR